MIIHGLNGISDALKISSANRGRRRGNTRVSGSNSAVSFRSMNNYGISRGQRVVASPAWTQKRCLAIGVDRHSIRLESVCSTIPDAVEQFVIRMKVSLISLQVWPSGLESNFTANICDADACSTIHHQEHRHVTEASSESDVWHSIRVACLQKWNSHRGLHQGLGTCHSNCQTTLQSNSWLHRRQFQ